MKQRMYNVFYSHIKIKSIANIVTTFTYFLLMTYYRIVRLFLINKKNEIVIDNNTEYVARKNLKEKTNINSFESTAINNPIDKDISLSIIMPAYNVEKYIKQSIESIINQKTKYNYELIVINDGSNDTTNNIIESINDSHIVLINQDNQGLSGARNTGLNSAKGKYVFFIDSDDILEDKSIDVLMDAIIENDADISIGGFYLFYDNNNAKQYVDCEDAVIENDQRSIIFNPGFAWGKIYKRELFHNVRFPMGAWFEDTLICSVIYRECKKMVKKPNCIYGYRQNWSGISKQSKKNYKSLDHIWVMEDAIKQAHNNGIKDDKYLYELCFGHFSTMLYRRISLLDESTKKDAFIISCGMMRKLINNRIIFNRRIEKDIEKAFETGNYKLWKLASFLV